MYNPDTNNPIPSGEHSFLKGLAKTVTSNGHAGEENRKNVGSVAENIAIQRNPGYRDIKLDTVKQMVDAVDSSPRINYEVATQKRLNIIAEAIAIMRMATSETTWLKIVPDTFSNGQVEVGSKSREDIVKTVCDAVLGDSVDNYDFEYLYGPGFVGEKEEMQYDAKTKLGTSPERRIMLIRAMQQFLDYAEMPEHKHDDDIQKKIKFALDALKRLTEGKVDSGLDQKHLSQARTEAASILAGRDIVQYRDALESYFGAQSVGLAEKLQIVLDLEVKNFRDSLALAKMIYKLSQNNAMPAKLQAALVAKIEDGLTVERTDEDLLSVRPLSDRGFPEEYLKKTRGEAKAVTNKELSIFLLGTKFKNARVATQALRVMSYAFGAKPALVLAEETDNNRSDTSRGSTIPDMSLETIQAIPAFILERQPLSKSEKSAQVGTSADLLRFGIEPKRALSPEAVDQAITFVILGYYKLQEAKAFIFEPEKVATYLEMVVSLNQKLPKAKRIALFPHLSNLSQDMGSRSYEPKIGRRIMEAGRKLVV